ncbi:unnamed protein product, partial [Closterium sp. NIES-53]
MRTTLAALGFAPSTADPSLFLRTDTFTAAVLRPCLHHPGQSSAHHYPDAVTHGAPVEFVEPSGPYPELVGCLMYLMTCTRLDLAYPLSLLARYVAPGSHRK